MRARGARAGGGGAGDTLDQDTCFGENEPPPSPVQGLMREK